MAVLCADGDVIHDAAGRPVEARTVAVLRALDKLLTVAGYYSADHDQYLQALETQCAVIVAAIRPRLSFAAEVTATGLVIDGRTLDPRQRAVRQVHDLLVSLNLCRVEISAALTPADLRQALSALHAHRLELSQAVSFRDAEVPGLPWTFSVAGHRVVQATSDDEFCIDTLVDSLFEPSSGLEFKAAQVVRADFLQDLMSVLRQAADNLDAGAADGEGQPVISRDELAAIHEGVQQLLRRDPGAGEIANLMELARRVLDVSGDPGKARFVFDTLRKDLDIAAAPPLPLGRREADQAEWPLAKINRLVAGLRAQGVEVPGPEVGARRDQLAISFRMLADGPRTAHFATALDALRRACRTPDIGRDEAVVITAALEDLARDRLRDVADRALPALLADLRETRPDLVAAVWSGLAGRLEPDELATVWPHLVNDLLLGLDSGAETVVRSCCRLAGELDFAAALAEVPRLLSLPGAERAASADQVFLLPPLQVRGVHAAVLHTAAAGRHGARLFRELLRHPPDRLTGIITTACADCEAGDPALLLALLRDAGNPSPSPELVFLATALLVQVLESMEPARRAEPWTLEAVRWLGAEAPATAEPLLRRIVGERRWMRAAWPEACRTEAAALLAATDGRD